MSAPIKHEDIKAGDRIRLTSVREYTADRDSTWTDTPGTTYELIERPVQLPTEPGVYADKDGDTWRLYEGGLWRLRDFLSADVGRFAPFTLLRPVAEVAAEVLAEVVALNAYSSTSLLAERIATVAAKWATK